MSNEIKMLGMLPTLAATFDTPIHVIELGANDGYHTHQFVQFLNSTGRPYRYIAVEPDPRLNLHLPPNVVLARCAVGEKDGHAKFHLSSGVGDDGQHYSGSSSLRPPTELLHASWPKMRFDQEVDVEVLTVDTLCDRHGLDHVDFIWCDTQGCEGDIIRGAPKTFQNLKWFFTEYSGAALYAGQAVFADLPKMLAPHMVLHTDMNGDALFCAARLKS